MLVTLPAFDDWIQSTYRFPAQQAPNLRLGQHCVQRLYHGILAVLAPAQIRSYISLSHTRRQGDNTVRKSPYIESRWGSHQSHLLIKAALLLGEVCVEYRA